MSATVTSNNPTEFPRSKSRADQNDKTVRVFNARLALATVLAVAILGPSLYFWHAYQVERTAGAFQHRADQLEAQEDWAGVATYLHRYLGLHPADDAVRVRMTEAFERGAKDLGQKKLAINVYYRTLGLIAEEDQPSLRCRLAKLLLELYRFPAAEVEARKLLAADDHDARAKRILALALYGQVRSGVAAAKAATGPAINQVFESALEGNPGDIRLSAILAELYRGDGELLDEKTRALPQAERESLADRIMDQMVAANSEDHEAYLAHCRYRISRGLPGADEDIRSALKYGSDQTDVLLAAAELAKQDGKKNPDSGGFQEARGHYESLLKANPKDERGYLFLGNLHMEQGNPSAALETWRRGLKEANKDSLPLNQRLAETLVAMRKADEADVALKALDGIVAKRGPRLPSNQRVALECACDFVRSQWWILKGEPVKALPLLKRVVAHSASPAEMARCFEAWMLIGRIHVVQGESDQAAAAFEQATLLQPRSAPARLATATAWANAGHLDLAVRFGEQALAIDGAVETQIFLAEAYCRQQLSLPNHKRNWQLFNKTIADIATAAAKQPLQNPWRLNVLRANALLAGAGETSPDEVRRTAMGLLQAAEDEYSASAALLQILPLAWERWGCSADADRAATKLERLPDQAFPAAVARFQLCMSRKQYPQAREVLQAAVKAVPSQSLQLGLYSAMVSMEEGRQEEGYQELSRLQADFPGHVLLLRQLAEVAESLGKTDEAQRWEEKLREREGPDGVFWRYFRARRLLTQTQDTKDPRFQEAEKLADELQVMRPSWPPAHLLLGLVAQRQGRIDRAIEASERAVRLGERRTSVYEQLVQMLYAQHRFAEAEEYLRQLQEQVPFSEGLSSTEISLATQSGDMKRALATAQRGVESRPQDPMAHIWLGQVQLAAGQTEDAERTLLAAVKDAPSDVRTYNALFDFYLRTNRSALAIKTLEDIDKNVTMSPAEHAFVFAQGYERIGNAGTETAEYLKKAGEEYEKAQGLNPDNAAVLERRAAFLSPRDPAAAENVLRRALEVNAKSLSARRMLAAILASRGGAKEWSESQSLLEQSDSQSTAADQRLQATLLARRGGKDNFVKARGILEKLTADSKQSSPDDFLLMAQICEAEGKVDIARQQYLAVANRAEANPAHMGQCIDFLLRHDGANEAAPLLEKLQQRQPDDVRVLALRARWLHGQKRTAEIEPLVEAFSEQLLKKVAGTSAEKGNQERVDDKKQGQEEERQRQAAREILAVQQIGDVYTAAEQHVLAERWYRRAVTLEPQRYAALVGSLKRQNRFGEAVAVCVEAAKTDQSVQPAVVLAVAFAAGQPTPADFEAAEPLFSGTLASHADNVDLLNAVAGVRVIQQRTDEAADLYRRIVAIKPKDVFALNNLATLLAEKTDSRQEAIRAIDSAIDTAGLMPALLDTKGTILIYDGKAERAVPLLKEATMAAEVDSRFLFHLSLAYDGIGKSDDARVALQRARDNKLAQQILTPTDRRLLNELEKKLGL